MVERLVYTERVGSSKLSGCTNTKNFHLQKYPKPGTIVLDLGYFLLRIIDMNTKQIINMEPYLELGRKYGINDFNFINQYLPELVKSVSPDITFTSIGTESIETSTDITFPSETALDSYVLATKNMFEQDRGVFERTYDGGTLVRETYSFPLVREEARELVAKLPSGFDLANAASIGQREASGPYSSNYITVYFKGDYNGLGTNAYGIKLDAVTGNEIDIKLLFPVVPAEYASHIPENTTCVVFGSFKNTTQVVDVYFALHDEAAYAAYFGDQYIAPPRSTLGLGMVGLTINTADNSVSRTKRYTF